MVKLVNPSDSLWMFAIALHRMRPVSSICYNQEPHFQLRNFPWCKLWWSRSLWLCCKWIEGPSARSWRCGGPISDLSHKMNAFTEKHSHRSSSLKHIYKDNKGSWHSRLEWVYDNCHLSYLIQIILSELSFTLSRAGSTCFFHNLPVVFCKSDRCSWKKTSLVFSSPAQLRPRSRRPSVEGCVMLTLNLRRCLITALWTSNSSLEELRFIAISRHCPSIEYIYSGLIGTRIRRQMQLFGFAICT